MAGNGSFGKIKIVCTAGPASANPRTLGRMVSAGMDVLRLNFSHGTPESHAGAARLARRAFAEHGAPCALLQDLPGPKLRLGRLPEGGVRLVQHQTVAIVHAAASAVAGELPFPDLGIIKSVAKGDTIFLSDGLLRLEVEKAAGGRLVCRVVNGGMVRSGCGLNLPDLHLELAAFTAADARHLRFGVGLGVNFAAVSFVSRAGDILRARKFLKNCPDNKIAIVAKIERPRALENLEEIVSAADAVMVARGDLGVELEPCKVPFAQKRIIAECSKQGRPVIVATQMLESMIASPRPTRAELTDVANAALDGADAVMLSGETTIGKYPVEAVKTLSSVIAEAEKYIAPKDLCGCAGMGATACAVGAAAAALAERIGAKAIVVPVFTGETLRAVSHLRPRCRIIALPAAGEAARFSLLWGVRAAECAAVPRDGTVDVMRRAARCALNAGLKKGDTIVVACSIPYRRHPENRLLATFRL